MDTRTIIIGLGGTGSKIVDAAYSRMDEKARKNCLVACFDTDVDDLKKLKNIPDEWKYQTSTANTVGDYRKAYPDVNVWFPVIKLLDSHTLTKGAAQFRVISRLAFRSAMGEGKLKGFEQRVEQLFTNEGNQFLQTPRVFVINTVNGGTGAGTFLQMGLYLRKLLRKRGVSKIDSHALILLPEIFRKSTDEGLVDLSQNQKDNMAANGYSCMKELNAMVKLNSGKFSEDFKLEVEFNPATGKQVKSNPLGSEDLPFEYVFLTDFTNAKGDNLNTFSLNYFKQVEDTLFLLAASPTGSATSSVTNNELGDLVKENGTNRYFANTVSKLCYPVKDVARFCAIKWIYDNISNQWMEIDNRYAILLKQYLVDKAQGKEVDKPDRSKHFQQTLAALSNDETTRFFKKYFNQTLTQKKDKEGKVKFGEPKSSYYFNKLAAAVDNYFENDRKYKNYSESKIDLKRLQNEDGAHTEVEEFETSMHNFKEYIFKSVDSAALDITSNAIPLNNIPDHAEKANKYDYDLTKLITDGEGTHPLGIRYILYQLEDKLTKEFEALQSENEELGKEINEYYTSYTVEGNEGGENAKATAVDALSYASRQSFLRKLTGNRFKRFTELYKTRAQKQQRSLQSYALNKCKELVFKKVLKAVRDQLKFWEQLFDNLTGIQNQLAIEMDQLNYLHETQRDKSVRFVLSAITGYREVLAKGAGKKNDTVINGFKEKIWSEISHDYIQEGLPASIANNIFYLIYKGFAEDFKENRFSDAQTATRTGEVLRSFKDEIVKETSAILERDPKININTLQALRKEAEYAGKKTKKEVDDYVEAAFSQIIRLADAPLVQFNVDSNYQALTRIGFWGINPEFVPENAEGKKVYDSIQNLMGNGKYKIADSDVFRRNEIVFTYTYCCFSLTDLKLFNPSGHLFEEGEYYKVYRERIDNVLRSNMKLTDEDETFISPHLDQRWHKRTYLPEIHDNFTRIYDEITREAILWGVIYKSIQNVVSENTICGYEWKLKIEDVKQGKIKTSWVVLKDDNGDPVEGSVYHLIKHLQDEQLVVQKIFDSLKQKEKDDTSNSNPEDLNKREFYKRLSSISYQGESVNILEFILRVAYNKEQVNKYKLLAAANKRLAEKFLAEFTEEMVDAFTNYYTLERKKPMIIALHQLLTELKAASPAYQFLSSRNEFSEADSAMENRLANRVQELTDEKKGK